MVVALLTTGACSSDPNDEAADVCAGAPKIYAYAGTPSGDCLESNTLVLVACGTVPEGFGVNICAERDGIKYWGHNRGQADMLPGFERCYLPAPPRCELAACAEVKRSYHSRCSFADTQLGWACGSGDLDENCCLRAPCAANEDCSAGEHCEAVDTIDSRSCYVDSEQVCQCEGLTGGLGAMVCVPD